MTEPGRTRHYGGFYGLPSSQAPAGSGRHEAGRPLWLVMGNCQAEALRQALDAVDGRAYRTVRVPPVHELEAADLPHLEALLRQTAVLLSQPIRADYRALPLGTQQMVATLPPGATVVRWPVIRYAGLYPFQVIVRRPADRSLVPPPVPYHDLRTIAAAIAGRSGHDPWDVEVEPGRFRAIAEASRATMAERERRDTDVAVSDLLMSAGADAVHSINHPGNTVLVALARRLLAELGVGGSVELGPKTLLGSVYTPLEQRVLDALELTGQARTRWTFDGASIDAGHVHQVQMDWYRDNPDLLRHAVDRHHATMDLLGLPTGGASVRRQTAGWARCEGD